MILPTGDRLRHPVSECWLHPNGDGTRRAEDGAQVVALAVGTVQYPR